ncbi:hypothetical protein FS749_015808 [Ceratobasidium sp. UAMH 11750]|nr:hypothetical protein FS749_015808 [Ceratobasidium sp. UAMH 11750]
MVWLVARVRIHAAQAKRVRENVLSLAYGSVFPRTRERLVHLLGVEDQVEQVNSQARGTSETVAAQGAEEEAKYGDGTGEAAKQLGQAAMDVGAGVRDGTAIGVNATRDAATSIVEHDAGPEAVELASKGGEDAFQGRFLGLEPNLCFTITTTFAFSLAPADKSLGTSSISFTSSIRPHARLYPLDTFDHDFSLNAIHTLIG